MTTKPSYTVDLDHIFWNDLSGLWHREVGPALIDEAGHVWFCDHHDDHRAVGPSAITPEGTVKFFLNGELHRANGPAVITYSGSKEYWINDKQIDIVEFFSANGST